MPCDPWARPTSSSASRPTPSVAVRQTPRVAAGIISYADLTLGAAVDEVLEAHLAASPRFRGIRHASGWHASPDIRNSHTNPPEHLLLDRKFREGFARLAHYGLVFDSWHYHPQLHDLADLARAFPETTIVLDHVGGPLGIGPYEGRHAEVFPEWKRGVAAVAANPNVVVKLGGIAMPVNGFNWHKRADAAELRGARRVAAALLRDLHRALRPEPLHVREQLPGRSGVVLVRNAVERVQADRERRVAEREGARSSTTPRARVYRV